MVDEIPTPSRFLLPIPVMVVNVLRKGRPEPRVIKDLQNTYPKMKHPRAELRKGLKKQAKTLK